ncbi:phosphodiester glycosidase family protein [Spirosoma sp. RP8]|uniref:Phosphodiester glycosidase family protein n=1 Tax=Spirosoma liriopis TaxID=2937440 RepID=A0ABT0HJ47_9BACT|nr:phosphodiester glycosidase family protein [Spirosoma liriopis]MCK8492180.1 phosphodiester glycosidase family protein [Spirosoma liriopis]
MYLSRVTLLVAITLLSIRFTFAQSTDSVQVKTANWRNSRIHRRILWQEAHFDSLFKSKQNINLIVLKNRRRPTIAFGSAGDSLKPTSWFGQKFKALVALNGTFFDTKKGGSVDLIKIDDRVLDTTRLSGKTMVEHQQAAIVIHKNKVELVFGGNQPGWDRQLSAENVMTTGPLLLLDGQPHPLQKNAFNDNRHPRACLCVGPGKRLILATVDGRNANAQGMNLHELTDLMRWLGCRDAINLDGGGSTTLWIRSVGQGSTGVVNYPSDSKQWIHTGERPVSNVILIR